MHLGPVFLPYSIPALLLAIAVLPKPEFRFTSNDGLLAIALALIAFGVLFAGTPKSLPSVALSQWLVAYAFGRVVSGSRGLVGALQNCAAFSAVLLSTAAIVEFAFDWHPFVNLSGAEAGLNSWAAIIYRGDLPRAELAFGHPIALGGALVLLAPSALLHQKGERWWRLRTAFCVAGVFATISRGPIIALGLMLLLCAAVSWNSHPRLALFWSTIAGVGALVALRFFGALGETDAAIADSSAYRRVVFTQLPSDLRLIGMTNNGAVVSGRLSYRGLDSIDSVPLFLAATGGVLVALSMVLVILSSISRAIRSSEKGLAIGLIVQLPLILTVGFVTQYAILLWIWIGLFSSPSDLGQNDRRSPELWRV